MTDRLDLPARYRTELEALLREHVPEAEVWAYGSRVNGESHEGSDLDLVLRGPNLQPLGVEYVDLTEALEKSNIPILVQLHDWTRLPESFHKEIERDYVVVQGEVPYGRWPRVALGDVATITKGLSYKGTGLNLPGPLLLGLGEVHPGGGAKLESVRTYGGEYKKRHVVHAGDLLVALTDVTQTGDVLGSPLLVPTSVGPECLFTHHVGHVAINLPEVDRRFLYYVLRGPGFASFARGYATGTTVRALHPQDAARFEFSLPPLPEQRAIAHVLGTLDDKIELNRRMNETLEEMARALFKSWFVSFEPVRAKMDGRWRRGESLPGLPAEHYDLFPDRLVPSELGEIPEGWDVKELGEVVELNPKESMKRGTVAHYLDMASLPTSGSSPNTPVLREFKSGTRFRNGDTLLARITPCLENGKTAFVRLLPEGTVGWGSTEFIVMRAIPPVPPEYTYLLARDTAFREHAIQSMTGTSGRQRVQVDALAPYLLPYPTADVWAELKALASPMLIQVELNRKESLALTEQRETLLPGLVTGEIQI